MKKFLSRFIKEVAVSIERFFTTFCLIIVLFLVNGYMVVFEPEAVVLQTMQQIVLTLWLGIFFCTLGKMLFEKYGERIKIKRVFAEIGLVLLSALAYLALEGYENNPYIWSGYVGVIIAMFVGIVYTANTAGISKTFSYIFKNTVFNGLVCGIVYAGTALSIFAFQSLIYDFNDSYKVYAIAALLIWVVLFFNLSLSAIPRRDAELKIPNLFKAIVMYVGLPVYLLLIAILYGYLGKILLAFNFPSGQVNWFASFASLMFIFFVLALEQYKDENKAAKVFVKFGGYAIIPIIVVQFIAMYIRLSNYGLTTSRYISLVLNIVALVFAVVTFVKNGRYIKHMLIAVICLSLLLTVTPLNIHDVPRWEQTARLTQVLQQNDMIENGKIVAKDDISQEDKITITSAYNYLDSYYFRDEKMPDIIVNTEREGFALIFGFAKEYEENDWYNSSYNFYSYYNDVDVIDIAGYSKLHKVYVHNDTMVSIQLGSGEPVSYNLTKDVEALYAEYGEVSYSDDVKMEFQVGANKLILTHLGFEVDDNNEITINSFEGYFLER